MLDNREDLLYKDETFDIRGAIFDVYREMGCGFLEAVYQECLSREFSKRGMTAKEQADLLLTY